MITRNMIFLSERNIKTFYVICDELRVMNVFIGILGKKWSKMAKISLT